MPTLSKKLTINISNELYQKLCSNAERNAVTPSTRARQLLSMSLVSEQVMTEQIQPISDAISKSTKINLDF